MNNWWFAWDLTAVNAYVQLELERYYVTFALWHEPFVCRLSSAVCLSVYNGCHTANSSGCWRHSYLVSELFLTAPNRNILTYLHNYSVLRGCARVSRQRIVGRGRRPAGDVSSLLVIVVDPLATWSASASNVHCSTPRCWRCAVTCVCCWCNALRHALMT